MHRHLLWPLLAFCACAVQPVSARPVPASRPEYVTSGTDGGFMNSQQLRTRAQNWRGMIRAAEERKKLHPREANVWLTAAFAKFKLGDVDGAERDIKRAIEVEPARRAEFEPHLTTYAALRRRFPGLRLQEPVWEKSDIQRENEQWSAKAAALLKARQYDEIERVAAGLLASRAVGIDGMWTLETFARGLWMLGEGKGGAARWNANQAAIAAWRKARPASVLAKTAALGSWIEGAWLARGDGFANEVSDQQFAKMEQSLAQGGELVPSLMPQVQRSPLVGRRLLNWGLGTSMPREQYLNIARDGRLAFPTYLGFDISVSTYLMERWFGEELEWEKYVAERADSLGGVPGDILYARIAIDQRPYYKDLWKESALDWPRVKRGCEALLKQHPGSLGIATQYFLLAYLRDDETPLCQRLLVNVIRNRVEPGTWKSLGRFAAIRMNTLTTPVEKR